jgi:hypothetical protein
MVVAECEAKTRARQSDLDNFSPFLIDLDDEKSFIGDDPTTAFQRA